MRSLTPTARASTRSSSRSSYLSSKTKFLVCQDFNLGATLASGQLFRWRVLPDERFFTWIEGSPVRIAQRGAKLIFQGASPGSVRRFFSLDQDLGAIARRIDMDPQIHQALDAHWGLRLIRQDPWECMVSFILSAYNNIPRLTGMLARLAESFGEPLADRQYRFPKPEVIARVSQRDLRKLGLGFRAPYIEEAARRVAEGRPDLNRLQALEEDRLREELLKIPGVGEKVVECILLFAYGRTGAFPVDVWIGRTMRAWYFRRRKVTDRKIREFARNYFGPHCGWAQQYLYCQIRGQIRGQPIRGHPTG